MKLSTRERELIEGMIKVQKYHAERSLTLNNKRMGEKQHKRDMERVELLERILNETEEEINPS